MTALTTAVVVLAASGVLPRWPGLVHAVAPPPLDLAFDLRVLVARSPSYLVFAAGLVLALAVRVAALATILRGLGRPRPVRAAALFYAAVSVPLFLGAGLEWAGYAAVYHWYFWGGLGLVVVTALVGWGSPLRTAGGRIGRGFASMVAVGLLGAAATTGPWAAVALVPVSAAVTVLAVAWLIRPPPEDRRTGSVVALAVVLVAAALPPQPVPADAPEEGAVLFLVPGVDTSSGRGALYRLDPEALGYRCRQVRYYSYRGPGPGADRGAAPCRLRGHAPYERADTQAPLGELVSAFVAQLREIRRDHPGSPVVVVTHSQGGWVAWRSLARRGPLGVTHLVMLAMFPRSAASYPPPGRDGSGRVGADVLRALTAVSHGLDTATFDPDAPLARQTLARRGAIEAIFEEPLPAGVTAATVFSTLDVAVAPEGWTVPGALDGGVVDATHAGLPRSAAALVAVRRALTGGPGPPSSTLAAVLARALPAWGPPPDARAPTGVPASALR